MGWSTAGVLQGHLKILKNHYFLICLVDKKLCRACFKKIEGYSIPINKIPKLYEMFAGAF